MATVATNTLRLHLRTSDRRRFDIAVFATKGTAVAYLTGLRAKGLNCGTGIEVQQTATTIARTWTLADPDHFHGLTYLMTAAGAWVPGRLEDAPCFCTPTCAPGLHLTPWRTLHDPPVRPATFTHITRTVPDAANRTERYRTKSNGSCGRYVRTDESIALCTCGWKAWEDTRGQAQAAARVHRDTAATEAAEKAAELAATEATERAARRAARRRTA